MNSLSLGALRIVNILEANKKHYITEKIFSDLRGKAKTFLRFDFCIFKNGEMDYLIEYDSELHFQRSGFHKKHSDFTAAAERDRKKNAYCLAHKIKLYRIPYWEVSNLKTLSDLTADKFLVTSIFHNDTNKPPCPKK